MDKPMPDSMRGVLLIPLVLETDDENSFERSGIVVPAGVRVVVQEDIGIPHLDTKADRAHAAVLARKIGAFG